VNIFSSTTEERTSGLAIADAGGGRSRPPTPTQAQPIEGDRRRRAILSALPSMTGRTLEIATDEGELGALLAERATVLVRLEPDATRARRLAAQGNSRVRVGGIRRRLLVRHYDTVVCAGELGAVPLREAPLVRERLVRSLKASGILVLQHGPGADTLHPPFLDHGLETVSQEVLDGVETLVLRRPDARPLADAARLLSDLAREPWPAPALPSGWTHAEAHLETGQVVDQLGSTRAIGAAPHARRLVLRVGDRPAAVVTAPGPLPGKDRLTELAPRVAGDLAAWLGSGPRDVEEMVEGIKQGIRPCRHLLTSSPRPLQRGEVTVAVCTARGPEVCEELISELTDAFNVMVLENGTDRDRLAAMCAATGATYEHDPRPGLAAARNRALRLAGSRWVLFLDDDCRLDAGSGPDLARRLGGAIDRVPDAGAIGGLVLPASVASEAEQEFERIAGHGRGFVPTRYDAHSSPDRWWPLRHGDWMAVGACLAVRREAWEAVGGFDERLGAGSAAASAEDDAFLRGVIENGWSVFYDPAVLVRHQHRGTKSALRRQLFGYGLGRSVHVLLRALDTRDWETLSLWAALLLEGWQDERSRPLRLGGAELLGYLAGPLVAMNTVYRRPPVGVA
jgi:GT2 family glycosyltransferase